MSDHEPEGAGDGTGFPLPPPPPPPPPGMPPPPAGTSGVDDWIAAQPSTGASGGTVVCRVCGRTPAVDATFAANTGLVIARRWSRMDGPFCRSCGIAAFRKQMNHTLALGWFGLISLFSNFVAIPKNLMNRQKVVALGEPTGPERARGLDPGKPLYLRPGIYVTGAILIALFVVVPALAKSSGEQFDGKCIEMKAAGVNGETSIKEVGCGSPHDAKVVAVLSTDSTDTCPLGADDTIILDDDKGHVLCVDFEG